MKHKANNNPQCKYGSQYALSRPSIQNIRNFLSKLINIPFNINQAFAAIVHSINVHFYDSWNEFIFFPWWSTVHASHCSLRHMMILRWEQPGGADRYGAIENGKTSHSLLSLQITMWHDLQQVSVLTKYSKNHVVKWKINVVDVAGIHLMREQ